MNLRALRDHLALYELADADRTWVVDAACKGVQANFFPAVMGEHGSKEAMAICQTCRVRQRCLEYAINNDIEVGIWGGLHPRGRRELVTARLCRTDRNRLEHRTNEIAQQFVAQGHAEPVKATAELLGLSTATVYHHIRIVKLAERDSDNANNE